MKQTIDQGVLQAALVGFELQRDRIEAAIAEIQTELGQGPSRPAAGTATTTAEPKTTGRKKFSAAARKRMALAQKKRWAALKAKKAEAAKPKRKSTAKRKKVSALASRKQRPVQVRAKKKVAPRVKARKAAASASKPVEQPKVEIPVPEVQLTAEPAPAESTA